MQKKLTRRDFLQAGTAAAASFVAGCAANPVTGQSQLMLLSESQEVAIDRQNSPQQFSADYGVNQDSSLNRYLDATGKNIAARTHRPAMPYSFQCVNAVYINAYAFPGGTIAVTRGALLALNNEAELAALFSHELGHVNARHTAQQMTKGTLTQLIAGGLAAYAGSQSQSMGQMASKLGSLGAGALLASYSRDHEREADALSIEYMTRAGYNPSGVLGLMEMLNKTSDRNPSAVELMFATHPMSSERYATALQTVERRYSQYRSLPLYRERFMDNTASLRSKKKTIEAIQQAQKELGRKNFQGAEALLNEALKNDPNDYTALALMSQLFLVTEQDIKALAYAEQAKAAYPQEAQGHYLAGLANIRQKRYQSAVEDFSRHQKILGGNPNTVFYLGLGYEGMQQRPNAAQHYVEYLRLVNQGGQAEYAYKRLVEWGYIAR